MIARHKRAPGTQSEDLGRQTTSGYAALGPRQGYEPGSDWFSTGARYSEMWCSDSLGAVVRQAHGREWRNGEESSNESTMQNIERANPILHSSKSPRTTLSSNEWREIATSRRLPMLSLPYRTILSSSRLLLSTSAAAFSTRNASGLLRRVRGRQTRPRFLRDLRFRRSVHLCGSVRADGGRG